MTGCMDEILQTLYMHLTRLAKHATLYNYKDLKGGIFRLFQCSQHIQWGIVLLTDIQLKTLTIYILAYLYN